MSLLQFSGSLSYGTWDVYGVHGSSGYLVSQTSVDAEVFHLPFPKFSQGIDDAVPDLKSEVIEIPPTTGEPAALPTTLFSAKLNITIPPDYAKILADFVNHTVASSFTFSVSMLNNSSKAYVDATGFEFSLNVNGWLKNAVISSLRYVGTSGYKYVYRLYVMGILQAIPPSYITVYCGPLKSKTLIGDNYSCYVDINFLGVYLSTAVVVSASTDPPPGQEASLRPELQRPSCSDPTHSGPRCPASCEFRESWVIV